MQTSSKPNRAFSAFALLPLALLLAACPSAEAPPPEETVVEVPEYSIQQFLGTTTFSGGSFSPDGSKILVSSDETGIFNAYTIPTAGGPPVALTESTTESIMTIGFFPNDERFLYSSDQGGNELNHVYVREVDGTVVDLTPGEKLRAVFMGWADDQTSFFLGINERDPRFTDVYEVQADDYEKELVFQDDVGYIFGDVSPDRRYLALGKVVTNAESDIYLHDRETGESTLITPHEGEVNHFVQAFSPDGEYLYYTTDAESEFNYVARYHLESGEHETVEQHDWDVLYTSFSWTGEYRYTAINQDGRTELFLYDAESGEEVSLPEIPDAEITSVGFSRDDSTLLFYASSSRNPRDLFVHELASGGPPLQLTKSLSAEIDPDHLVAGEVVRFDSFDGVEIPGILYQPHGARAENKVPAVVWVHGGPGGQSRVGYNPLIQYLVNHGYGVYAINNRGSSGYGKTFFHLDDRNHGKNDLGDCVASKEMLIGTGWVEPEKIGILGGSYGGYMVLAALTFRPEEFAVGVDIFGISNWYRTVQNIPPWWEAQRKYLEAEMGDFDDEEYFRSISPLFHADQIVRPLMVLQGANDPRVLQAESDDIVEAARANGVPVEYIVFPDEGHGFRKKENQERGYEAIRNFLDRYLAGEAASAEAEPAAEAA